VEAGNKRNELGAQYGKYFGVVAGLVGGENGKRLF
jgi:hypothetical protein